jgi:hypothetical protein
MEQGSAGGMSKVMSLLDEDPGMQMGLLWFDDNPKVSFAAKIEKAARRYRERFGRAPDMCYVHPQTLAGVQELPARVRVIERTTVQPNNFWIGVKSS